MNFDLTITFAVILSITSIISPIIVTKINNNHQLTIKRYENQELAKREAIIEFINATSECIAYNGKLSGNEFKTFQKSANKLLLYFPDIDIKILDNIQEALMKPNVNTKNNDLRPLIIKLSKQLTEI